MELVAGRCGHLACWTKHVACCFVPRLTLSSHSQYFFLYIVCVFPWQAEEGAWLLLVLKWWKGRFSHTGVSDHRLSN